MPSRAWISADRAAALVLIVLFAAYGAHGSTFESSLRVDFVGPDFFPRAVGILGVFLGTLLLISRPAGDAAAGSSGGPELAAFVPIGLMLAYVLSLEFLGFPIATVAFLILTVRYLGCPSWLGAAAFGVITTAAAVLLFRYGLVLRLPPGDLIRLW